MKKIIFLLFLAVLAVAGWLFWGFLSGNGRESSQSLVIKSGQGVNEISRELKQQGIIQSQFIFETAVGFKQAEDKLQAGVYDLPADVSVRELINIFILGPASN